MPKRDKFVSLWMGHADSSTSLDQYLEVGYTEDGDIISSAFATNFGIKRYDEDFVESHFYDAASRSMRELLSGFSYDNVIITKFIDLLGASLSIDVNAIILLFNFEYTEEYLERVNDPGYLRYMGTVAL